MTLFEVNNLFEAGKPNFKSAKILKARENSLFLSNVQLPIIDHIRT